VALRRAERALGACLLAVLSACAAVQEPQREAPAPAGAQHAPAPVTAPTIPAETPPSPADEAATPQPLAHGPDTQAARTLELLHEAERFAGLTPDAQQPVLAEAQLRHDREQTPLTLVRLALLLSVSEPDRQDSADAAARLRNLLDAPPDASAGDLEALARLLMQVLDEREHLLAQNAELQRKLNQLKAIEQQLGDRDGADAPQPVP